MSGWKEVTLGEIAEVQTGPFGSLLHASDYVAHGIPSIMPTNIGRRLEINKSELAYINQSDAKRLSKYLVDSGDIVYSRRGDVEKCAFITDNETGWLCGTGCLRVRITSDDAIPRFIALYLSTNEIKGWVSGHAVGTTMPNLNTSILGKVPISLPSLPEQKAIASILSSLDDKIDLLHRQNTTLEKMAQTLFRQWFVEEAKEEWEEGTLDDILTIKGGTTPSTEVKEYWGGNIHWTSPRDITTLDGIFLFDTERKITELGLQKIGSGLLPAGTLLMSSRAPVGVLAFAEVPLAINQGYIGIIDDKGVSKEFIYLWLKENMETVQSYANGSTFLEISKSAFKTLQISKPPKALLKTFQSQVEPFFNKIKSNQTQIRTLSTLRDTLLPKLMSGEVRVAAQ